MNEVSPVVVRIYYWFPEPEFLDQGEDRLYIN